MPPRRVFPQSFDKDDVLYWVRNEPAFGRQAVYLDDAETRADLPGYAELAGYKQAGINIVGAADLRAADRPTRATGSCRPPTRTTPGPPASTSSRGRWSARACSPTANNGFYYQTFDRAITREGDMMRVLDVLARRVGISGRLLRTGPRR